MMRGWGSCGDWQVGWLLSGVIVCTLAGPAAGQPVGVRGTAESVRSLRLAEYNQLGVLEYCLAQGAIRPEVVALQRAALERLPAGAGAEEMEAQLEGRRGMVGIGEIRAPIADAAMGEGIPVSSRCKQMGLTVQAQAGKVPVW